MLVRIVWRHSKHNFNIANKKRRGNMIQKITNQICGIFDYTLNFSLINDYNIKTPQKTSAIGKVQKFRKLLINQAWDAEVLCKGRPYLREVCHTLSHLCHLWVDNYVICQFFISENLVRKFCKQIDISLKWCTNNVVILCHRDTSLSIKIRNYCSLRLLNSQIPIFHDFLEVIV